MFKGTSHVHEHIQNYSKSTRATSRTSPETYATLKLPKRTLRNGQTCACTPAAGGQKTATPHPNVLPELVDAGPLLRGVEEVPNRASTGNAPLHCQTPTPEPDCLRAVQQKVDIGPRKKLAHRKEPTAHLA